RWSVGSSALWMPLGRFSPVFALMAAPILAATMPALVDGVLIRWIVWAMIGVSMVVCAVRVATQFPRSPDLCGWLDHRDPDVLAYPCKAADYLEANVSPHTHRLINEFNWGGFLEWRLAGKYQVFLDGRTQVFGREFWETTYMGTEQSRFRVLRDANADAAILPVKKSVFREPLIKLGWRSI